MFQLVDRMAWGVRARGDNWGRPANGRPEMSENLQTLSDAQIDDLAQRLWDAENAAEPVAPLTESHPGMTPDDAFAIQLVNIRRRIDAGARVTGHKVGLASEAMQKMMGVGEPDYGHLLDVMEYSESVPVETSRLCRPRVELEVAFILGKDVPAAGVSDEELPDYIEWVVPSIELIDSRIADWKITLADTIADNASSCGYIAGEQRVPMGEIDVASIGVEMYKNTELIATGSSEAVLGNPLNAVSWLARKVSSFGVRLRAGDVLLPGTAIRAEDVAPGDHVRAEFAGLGSVTLDFA